MELPVVAIVISSITFEILAVAPRVIIALAVDEVPALLLPLVVKSPKSVALLVVAIVIY